MLAQPTFCCGYGIRCQKTMQPYPTPNRRRCPVNNLPIGTMKCPNDDTPLYWETLGGMRIWSKDANGPGYSAQCPKCLKRYRVDGPKKPNGD